MTATLLQPESLATSLSNESYLGNSLNDPNRWTPDMRRPLGVGQVEIDRYQKTINRIVGTFRDQPIIKLVWMPEVFEWAPCPLGSNPVGYTFPTWTPGIKDSAGKIIAPPRWGLMERMEPEQYLPGWENNRWVVIEGRMHDAKGPPPEGGHYTMWHRHIKHHSACCARYGNEDDCWGYYVEPNAELLEYIGMRALKARNDPDVQPTTPIANLVNRRGDARTREKLERRIVNTDISTRPRLLSGFVRQPNGLYTIGE